MPPRVFVQEPNGSVAVPDAKCKGLVLRLLVWPADLQHRVTGGRHERAVTAGDRWVELETPPLGAFVDQAGQTVEPLGSARQGTQVIEAYCCASIFLATVRASPRMSSAKTLPLGPAA